MVRKFSVLFVAAACLALAGCEEAPTPVASLDVSPAQLALPFPHYLPLEIEVGMSADIETSSPWVMLHLLDLSGSVVRTFDHALPGGWETGATRSYSVDLYQSALAPPLDPGTYQLTAGLYDPAAGRWALEVDGEQVHRMEYAVGTVEVTQAPSSAPKFFFSPTWMATEAGTDVQILGRRWLRSAGEIRLADLTAPGTVRLDLRIEAPDPQLEDLVLDEGYDDVMLDVTTTCSDQTWALEGVGTHVIVVTAAPGGGGAEAAADAEADADADADADTDVAAEDGCEVSLTPHYRVVTRRNLNARVLALDLLAWQPASP